jgi:hypothetical protein
VDLMKIKLDAQNKVDIQKGQVVHFMHVKKQSISEIKDIIIHVL